MPELGEIKNGREIGYRHPRKLIYHACIDCGKTRWVEYRRCEASYKRCRKCAAIKWASSHRGENHSQYKGRIFKEGYILVNLSPDSPYFSMAFRRDWRVYEHRLVMAEHLGRCIKTNEIVHHLNGNKSDNRIENLELNTRPIHMSTHYNGYMNGYKKGFNDGYQKGLKERHLTIDKGVSVI